MFKRKKAQGPEAAPADLEVPLETTTPDLRTTCYPQDGEAPPPVAGQPRTTVYRQSARWNRGGYDTVN